MSRLIGRVRTSIRLAPRALLSVTRLRRGRRQIVEESVAATTTSATTPFASTTVHPSYTSSTGDGLARSGRRRSSCAITKDTLLFGLEALSESADAFGPLKSVVGGLLFFAKQADVSEPLLHCSSPDTDTLD